MTRSTISRSFVVSSAPLLSLFGLLPQGLNGGQSVPPLAWSLIFGLLMSLALTLVVIPSFYKTLGGRSEKQATLNPVPVA